MNKTPLFLLVALALASSLAQPQVAHAKSTPAVPHTELAPAANSTAKQDDADELADPDTDSAPDHHDNARVGIGHDSSLPAGEHASAVVAILGNATAAGEVDQAVVAVLGNTHVTGTTGEAAVAVLGNTYVDGKVGGEVVAVFGNVELGPHAEVGGDVVAVGGTLTRDPAAIVHGEVQSVSIFGNGASFTWLQTWVTHCLLLGRPLAFAPGLGWAWSLALGFLALYVLIALLFPEAVKRCVHTMETQPGRSVIAAILTFLLKPIVFILILVTVIGAILVPFLGLALYAAGVFGKAVALAWIGGRLLPRKEGQPAYAPALAVLCGGALMLLLYVVPVVGFITYKLLDVIGLGIVVYTVIHSSRAAREASAASHAAAMAASPSLSPSPSASASAASAPASDASAADTATAAASAGMANEGGGSQPSAAPGNAVPPAAPPAAPPIASALLERAGFWIRMGGLAIDLVLVSIVCSFLSLGGHGVLLMLAGYGAVMWKLKGTTIGGIVCHIRVVRLDGREIDWPTAIVRALGCFLSLAVAGLGFLWVVFDAERQSWHDKIAGTVVVRVPRGTPLV